MTLLDAYYTIKPMIPRRLQIILRRIIAKRKLAVHRSEWPIDQRAGRPPEGWQGWPEGKKFALVLNHDVDTARGHAKCLRLMEVEQRRGFRSSFYFVPQGYVVSPDLRGILNQAGFEVGVHGLLHDGKMFRSRKIFDERATRVNMYLKDWGAVGFSSPSMHRNLAWVGDLDIAYDISTFDTDPFEPQPEGVGTIFPFWVPRSSGDGGFVELPYTLPQDHCLYVIFKNADNRVWREKLDWIAAQGGMALLDSHPDYMNFDGGTCVLEEYPIDYYAGFLEYARERYGGQYWQALSREVAAFWAAQSFALKSGAGIISSLDIPKGRPPRSGPA